MMTMILSQKERRSVRWPVLTYAGEVGSRRDAGLFQSQPDIRVSITSVLSKEQSAQDSDMPEAGTVHRPAQLHQVPADVPSMVATNRDLLPAISSANLRNSAQHDAKLIASDEPGPPARTMGSRDPWGTPVMPRIGPESLLVSREFHLPAILGHNTQCELVPSDSDLNIFAHTLNQVAPGGTTGPLRG